MSLTTTAASQATNATSTTKSASTIGGDFNTFLTLLTTQLKNQDPTKAMDTEAMVNQLAQFSSIEQQISSNDNLKTLIGLQQAAGLTAAAPLIGKSVEVESDHLSLQGGKAVLRLPAAGAATVAQVTVADAAGRVLTRADVTLGAGGTDWQWDGRNAAGNRQPDGAYRYAVAGRDASGTPQTITATVVATATAAERAAAADGGGLQLVLGGLTVGFDALRSLGR